jgi:hypothetical protein
MSDTLTKPEQPNPFTPIPIMGRTGPKPGY